MDQPRPFVIRAAHLDGCTVHSGEAFEIGVPYFDVRTPEIATVVRALEGLRGAELAGVSGESLLTLPLDPLPQPVNRIVVKFLTPTELKADGAIVERPDFDVLACRVRDRISTLRALYGEGPLDMDFQGFALRAAQVRTVRCEIQHVAVERRSRGTGQTHPLGGFTGEALYEGELSEFLPFLAAARWTGVGRQTVWGKGEIETVV